MYRKFRNVPIVKDFPPICPYFLGFRVGKYANAASQDALFIVATRNQDSLLPTEVRSRQLHVRSRHFKIK